MSKREKTLALIVGAMLPLLLVFWGLTSFSNSYFAKRQKIRALQSSVADEQDRLTDAQLAQQRRRYYASISIPGDTNQAKIDYEGWLGKLIEKDAQLKLESIVWSKAPEQIRYRTSGRFTNVAEQYTCTVRAFGSLDQITNMLRGFYELNILHRIHSINVFELSQSNSVTTPGQGKLKLEMEVQCLKLNDAPASWDFTSEENQLARETQDWVNQVVSRNFFGPANNTPVISTTDRSLTSDSEISFDVRADDADRADLLQFELVQTTLPGAKLVQEKDSDRRAILNAPAVAPGEYEVVVRVTDNGLPTKMVEKTIGVRVKEPVVVKREEPPKPPPFLHSKATYITGFKGKTLWVHVKTLNDKKFIDIGDSFELDGDEWTVVSIDSWRRIVLSCNGKLLTYQVGDTLDSPRETAQIDVVTPTENDVTGG